MKKPTSTLLLIFFGLATAFSLQAQQLDDASLHWEQKSVQLGSVMEEYGTVTASFFVANEGAGPIIINEVETDCGCTSVDFVTDTLDVNQVGKIEVSYQPTSFGGAFHKEIIVRNNRNSAGDTLSLEGFNIPFPENASNYYQFKVGDLGFRFSSVNMGEVFTNSPKVKYVDFYNFKDLPITLDGGGFSLPEHINIALIPAIVPAKSRGLLAISYDGLAKDDFGFFDEEISFNIEALNPESVNLRLLTTIHEYFAPVPVSQINEVPRLGVAQVEVDFGSIPADKEVLKTITLSNSSKQEVNIRKIVSNCDCMSFSVPKYTLSPGESMDLSLTFDPSGRLGIDHKMVTIFSNDPLNPTRTIVLKSKIKP